MVDQRAHDAGITEQDAQFDVVRQSAVGEIGTAQECGVPVCGNELGVEYPSERALCPMPDASLAGKIREGGCGLRGFLQQKIDFYSPADRCTYFSDDFRSSMCRITHNDQ
ncbi:hypothetical protein GCM10010278_56130 [Streptomyces melanogenes]|nr:hypothetical protein GCM10010278_56130 [Streptomyces melanogenes]